MKAKRVQQKPGHPPRKPGLVVMVLVGLALMLLLLRLVLFVRGHGRPFINAQHYTHVSQVERAPMGAILCPGQTTRL